VGAGGSSAGSGGSGAGRGGAGGAGAGGTLGCDADHDGALSKAAACGGDDCDDGDSSARPGQEGYFTSASATVGFDYDCDGHGEPQFQAIDCATQPLVDCAGEGFSGTPPACGEEGPWIECAPAVAPLPLLCVPQDKGTRRQACR
jgi:hypothetical protein